MGGEWKETLLEDLADEITVGFVGSMTSEYVEDGIPFFRSKNIVPYQIFWNDVKYISRQFHHKIKKSSLRPGDVVIVRTGKPGTASIIPDSIVDANCSDLVIVRPGSKLDKHFLVYYINSAASHHINAHLVGAVQQHFNVSSARKMSIPLPPLPEQKKIAHILGSLDDKIELNRQMNATLEGMAQTLFKSWFVDFDPVIDNAIVAGNPIPEVFGARAETRRKALADGTANREVARQFPDAFQATDEIGWIPEGWEVKAFGDVSICLDKKRIPLSKKQREKKKPGEIPYYGATSIMDYINEWIFEDTYLLIGEDGSVIKEDGSPFVQYIWGKSWINNHAHVLQGTSGISTEHLMIFMLSQNITAYVTGAVQLKINQKNMNSIPFLKAENKNNQYFTNFISPLYERFKQLTEDNKILTNLRNTLLPKLISGEIRISEAEKITEEALACNSPNPNSKPPS